MKIARTCTTWMTGTVLTLCGTATLAFGYDDAELRAELDFAIQRVNAAQDAVDDINHEIAALEARLTWLQRQADSAESSSEYRFFVEQMLAIHARIEGMYPSLQRAEVDVEEAEAEVKRIERELEECPDCTR